MKTVKQASEILNVNESRVRQFIYGGRLPAQKIGRDLLINDADLKVFAEIERKIGRPRIMVSKSKQINENS